MENLSEYRNELNCERIFFLSSFFYSHCFFALLERKELFTSLKNLVFLRKKR